MSVNISISNSKQSNCNDIIQKLLFLGVNCRVIETVSVVENNIEKGCLITLDQEFNKKNRLRNLWYQIREGGYECANLYIPGMFDGCIYNYINCNLCPGDYKNQ